MKKTTAAAITLAIIATFTAAAGPAHAGADKIGICHATGSGKYVSIEVSRNATAGGHAGVMHQEGADIIPAFTWIESGQRYYFDGQNLDKAGLLATGCKGAENDTAEANAPVYHPASCALPSKPFGYVTVPADLGTGVASATDPALDAANTVWSVTYTRADGYDWPAGFTGTYSFTVVPITADPAYVVDTRTGEGKCELANTGAGEVLLIAATIGGGLLLLGGLTMAGPAIARRRNRG